MPSFGSGSTTLGGAAGLARSIVDGSPALNQQSPSGVGFDPNLQVPAYPPMPQGNPVSSMHLQNAAARRGGQLPAQGQPQAAPAAGAPQPNVTLPVQDANPQQPGTQVTLSEAQTIEKALHDRLKHLSDHEKKVLELMSPPAQPTGAA